MQLVELENVVHGRAAAVSSVGSHDGTQSLLKWKEFTDQTFNSGHNEATPARISRSKLATVMKKSHVFAIKPGSLHKATTNLLPNFFLKYRMIFTEGVVAI